MAVVSREAVKGKFGKGSLPSYRRRLHRVQRIVEIVEGQFIWLMEVSLL
jgi:hypothetical protein